MEANLRQDVPPVAFPDLAESQDCTDLLTRSNSSSSSEESALTVGDLKDTFRHTLDSTPDKCTAWTNEKHSLYLRHLESSFIEQLHRSMGLSRRRSEHEIEGTTVSRKLSAKAQHASEKLTVLQDGSRKKIELNKPILESTADSRVVLESPWAQHLESADKSRIVISSHLQEQNLVPTDKKRLGRKRISSDESATSSDQIPVSLRTQVESVGCLEEFSDQNFAEDVIEKSSTFMSKRSKTSVADASSQDQIVPVGKSYTTVSDPGHTPSKIEEKAHQEYIPESDRNTF